MELFWNGSVDEFYRLKVLIALEQLITLMVEKITILMSKTSRFTGKPGARIQDPGRKIGETRIGDRGSRIGKKKLENKVNK